jgi:hypothetical protein
MSHIKFPTTVLSRERLPLAHTPTRPFFFPRERNPPFLCAPPAACKHADTCRPHSPMGTSATTTAFEIPMSYLSRERLPHAHSSARVSVTHHSFAPHRRLVNTLTLADHIRRWGHRRLQLRSKYRRVIYRASVSPTRPLSHSSSRVCAQQSNTPKLQHSTPHNKGGVLSHAALSHPSITRR